MTYKKYKNVDFTLVDKADNIIPADFIVNNYSTIYKTTGGGKSEKDSLHFIKKFINNKVLGIYLTFLGITTLTPSTLVPIALIFGQHVFQKTIKYMRKTEQSGGSVQVFDSSLLESYLKIAGLTQLSLSLNTLVPLGLAMAIYEAYKTKNNQQGGHFERLFIGENVPPGFLQLNHNYWNGNTIQNNIYSPLNSYNQSNRSLSFMNMELQPSNISNNNSLSASNINSNGMQVEVPSVNSESTRQVSAVHSEYSTNVESESGAQNVLVLPNTMA